MSVRRFELHDYSANSHKFWELHQKGGCWHPEYGRIAGFGRSGGRTVGKEKCDNTWRKTLAGKLKKGYSEVTGQSSTTPTSPAPTPPPPPKPSIVGVGLLNWATL